MDCHAALAAAVPGYARGQVLSLPGVWDGLSIKLVEQAGFPAAFLSGGALSMARHGRRDMGLVTMSELAQAVQLIREVSDLPLFVDADTGFGNDDNAVRTIRVLEAAGATAIQLEDQVFPKRCGFLAGKAVIPAEEYLDKLKAVLDARRGPTLVIARTDARSIEGFAAALDRACAYAEAGADLVFLEGPETVAEMQTIAAALPEVPLVHNLVEGGVSPVSTAAELQALGYAVALHPLVLLHGFIRQGPAHLAVLRQTGSTESLRDQLADLHEFGTLLTQDTPST
ncbi:MAG: isocitrate lyase/PEP mutase family protein [Novosphingobium sp.]|jgi:2-methylisocitrate lyase-like PEP mutase family enzyme|nr:isocitrate lyase/PEP mutase family protein [Novosphingobium sp.]